MPVYRLIFWRVGIPWGAQLPTIRGLPMDLALYHEPYAVSDQFLLSGAQVMEIVGRGHGAVAATHSEATEDAIG
jgi:hypothetical protein